MEKKQDGLQFGKDVDSFIKGLNKFILIFRQFFIKSVMFRENFVKNQ